MGSTQDVAAAAFDHTGRPTLVVADRQTAGRGRSGRPWWQADRALYSSLAFAPHWSQERLGVLPLVTAVVLHDAIASRFGTETACKWPNDLLTESGKVSGILVEAAQGRVVIGCGVNLWWVDPPDGAAGVSGTDPGEGAVVELARAWADGVLDASAAGPDAWPVARYRALNSTIGATVTWADGSGTAIGIADDGGLEVATGSGIAVLHSADVHFGPGSLPPATTEHS